MRVRVDPELGRSSGRVARSLMQASSTAASSLQPRRVVQRTLPAELSQHSLNCVVYESRRSALLMFPSTVSSPRTSEPGVRVDPHRALHRSTKVVHPMMPMRGAWSGHAVPAPRPPWALATVRRCSPPTSCVPDFACVLLAPFAMYAALPRSDYYEASAPLARRQRTVRLPVGHEDVKGGVQRFPRSLPTG